MSHADRAHKHTHARPLAPVTEVAVDMVVKASQWFVADFCARRVCVAVVGVERSDVDARRVVRLHHFTHRRRQGKVIR